MLAPGVRNLLILCLVKTYPPVQSRVMQRSQQAFGSAGPGADRYGSEPDCRIDLMACCRMQGNDSLFADTLFWPNMPFV
jgi:hypothetical protein